CAGPLPGAACAANNAAVPPVNGASTAAVSGRPPADASPGAAPLHPSAAGASVSGGAAPPPGPASGPPPPSSPPEECMSGFVPLRKEAEKRGKMIKAAGERHAPPDETCKLITNFGQAEIKMIKYVESHAAKCGIPPLISDQLKQGHKNTESMKAKVCAVAQQMQRRGPDGPTLSEVLGSSSAAIPEATPIKHNGGSIFDTLAGN